MNSIYIELFTLLNNMKQNIEEKKISHNILEIFKIIESSKNIDFIDETLKNNKILEQTKNEEQQFILKFMIIKYIFIYLFLYDFEIYNLNTFIDKILWKIELINDYLKKKELNRKINEMDVNLIIDIFNWTKELFKISLEVKENEEDKIFDLC